jgi:hypothetical protein
MVLPVPAATPLAPLLGVILWPQIELAFERCKAREIADASVFGLFAGQRREQDRRVRLPALGERVRLLRRCPARTLRRVICVLDQPNLRGGAVSTREISGALGYVRGVSSVFHR